MENESSQGSERPIEINKEMLIADIVEQFPELIEPIMDFGVHCVGCGASMFETLEEGFSGHGMSEQDIDEAVNKLNEYLKNISEETTNEETSETKTPIDKSSDL